MQAGRPCAQENRQGTQGHQGRQGRETPRFAGVPAVLDVPYVPCLKLLPSPRLDTPRRPSIHCPSAGLAARFFSLACLLMISDPPNLDLPFQYHRLANGLRVVLHRNAALPLVAVNLWYHVGSKNERPGRTGFAHLFEHMLFQGSEHVATHDHFPLLQRGGGGANGPTWVDP